MTINPAKLLGLPAGRLEKGAPADLILVDLGQPWVVDKRAAQGALQELALRREQDAGAACCTTMVAGKTVYQYAGGRARLSAASKLAVSGAWALLFSNYASLALLAGYLLGSIPFGLVLT